MQTKVRQEHFPALRTADVFAVVEVVVVVVFNLKKMFSITLFSFIYFGFDLCPWKHLYIIKLIFRFVFY